MFAGCECWGTGSLRDGNGGRYADAGAQAAPIDAGVTLTRDAGAAHCECDVGQHCEYRGELEVCVDNAIVIDAGVVVVDPPRPADAGQPQGCTHTVCNGRCGTIADVCGGTITCGSCPTENCAQLTAQYHNQTMNTDFNDPGTCVGCPGPISGFTAIGAGVSHPAGTTTVMIDGDVPNSNTCCWEVERVGGASLNGSAQVDALGHLSTTVPIFCGDNTVRVVCTNQSGRHVMVREVDTTCAPKDLKVTLAWDDQGRDMELHLIREGGRINTPTDCTWYTCISNQPPWSPTPDSNPHKDVDATGLLGPENIYLQTAEPISYDIMVEYWASGQLSMNEVAISVHEQAAEKLSRALLPHDVWHVGTVKFPGGTFTKVDTIISCAPNWRMSSHGCDLPLP